MNNPEIFSVERENMEELEKMQIANPKLKLRFNIGIFKKLYISLESHTSTQDTFKLSNGRKSYYLSLRAKDNFDINKDVNYMFLSFALNEIFRAVLDVKCFRNFEDWHKEYNKDKKNKIGTLITGIIWEFNVKSFNIFKKFGLTSDKKLVKVSNLIFSRMGEICYG